MTMLKLVNSSIAIVAISLLTTSSAHAFRNQALQNIYALVKVD
jgi:hypothetical protein